MSDYLTTLAARSLSQIPVARPRLASSFELPSSGGAMASAPGAAEEPARGSLLLAVRPPPVAADRARVRDASGQAHATAPPPTSAPRDDRDAGDRSRPHVARPSEMRPADLSVAAPPAPLMIAAASPASSAVHPKTAPAPVSGAASIERDRPREIPPEAPRIAPRGLRLDDVLARLTEDRLSSLERRIAQSAVRAEPVAARRDPAPRPRPEPAVRDASIVRPAVRVAGERAAGEPAQPTIRVTIGRLEVRAVMPESPAPAPRPAPSPAMTSLDEYLKERSGGGR